MRLKINIDACEEKAQVFAGLVALCLLGIALIERELQGHVGFYHNLFFPQYKMISATLFLHAVGFGVVAIIYAMLAWWESFFGGKAD